ncbi:MAG: ABC transporter ATP-binding protein [Oscillospiraceae bacterium]|jgi:simple sugar transport system ATP-binding protein|nr:ABC transporter ATP-binding protein [Oscillospiraceae bacterium]
MQNSNAEFIIEMHGVTKDFPGIRANDDVTLRLRRGEIHALLGENGAGKSTLMSILFGLYKPDKGVILKNGKPVSIASPNAANALGIGMVHQHFKLVHNFTALENIVMGVETTRYGLLRTDQARRQVVALSEKYGLSIDPDAKIEDVTVGMQQRVEILKMLYRENEILIFDEPTAVLTPQEIGELMKIMKSLAAEGKSILFITHKLNEIKQVAERCTVLRKGRTVGTLRVADTSIEMMSELMVGRKVEFDLTKNPAKPTAEPLLRVERLTVKSKHNQKPLVNDVSFVVRGGEIVCIAGIDGNGQRELAHALTGLTPVDAGRIFIGDKEITHSTARARNLLGMSHIPEDRHTYGLVLDYTVEENMALKSYFRHPFQRHGFLSFAVMRGHAERLMRAFDVRAGQGPATRARSLSGGNQQKAIIAREMGELPNILIAVQPTRGLDVGAIEYIHKRLLAARDEGKAILLISLELDEVLNISDRVHVIHEGAFTANLDAAKTTAQELGLYMAGTRAKGANA